jgi:hypothetical protein
MLADTENAFFLTLFLYWLYLRKKKEVASFHSSPLPPAIFQALDNLYQPTDHPLIF